ncbi:50S ribosomal protein L5 [Candidatus Saccharibacteria bacterium]|nr:50S ribosomal protein L5 [Candidatus Saccharibacteria bacterium]MBR2709099.1 50S ribosomal protein L5 [Candidatus Saccharibacteria bacterium]
MAEKKTAAGAEAKKTTAKKAVKADAKAQPRLKALYNSELKAKLQKELGLENINQVPELKKVVISSGVGKKREDKRFTETVELTIAKITGQKATSRLAKKSIASFKVRKGMGAPVGYLTTLRNDKMYEFVDRLINVALPHVRDFHGVSRTAFDAQGNYNLGIVEQTVFPEITFEDASVLHGLEVTFIIKNGSKEGSLKLLELFGMPFAREGK